MTRISHRFSVRKGLFVAHTVDVDYFIVVIYKCSSCFFNVIKIPGQNKIEEDRFQSSTARRL